LFYAVGRTRLSEDFFYAQDEHVAFGQVLGAALVVGVNEEEPLAAADDGAGTDPADQLNSIRPGRIAGSQL
jgi:hypothetical protein